MKKILCSLLACVMLFGTSTVAFAAEKQLTKHNARGNFVRSKFSNGIQSGKHSMDAWIKTTITDGGTLTVSGN